jgi:peptidoglycan hydrolase-like protein with peptidoglycan-binding domain
MLKSIFLPSRTVETGIVFALLMTGMLVLSLTSLASGSDLRKKSPALVQTNDVTNTQKALQDRGYYHGKVDGVMGLHTRASIRGFQKAEKLPITGQIDLMTSRKLGVVGQGIALKRGQIGTQGNKPWAGTRSANAVRGTRNTLKNPVPSAASAHNGQEYREDRLDAQNQKQPQ